MSYELPGNLYGTRTDRKAESTADKTHFTGNKGESIERNNKQEYFKILFWQNKPSTPDNLQNCLYQNCHVTLDKRQFNSSDAVVVTTETLINGAFKFSAHYRHPRQNWIILAMGSSGKVSLNMNEYSMLFNATASYDNSADIVIPLVEVMQKNNQQTKGIVTKVNYAQAKTKLAATYLDHCTLHSQRERYIR